MHGTLNGLGVEVELIRDFNVVRESLERIGTTAKHEKVLYPSCVLLHRRGQYYILSFLEMFILDGKQSSFGEIDAGRRNTIVRLLSEWGLIKVLNPAIIAENQVPVSMMKVVPFAEKGFWQICMKYTVGNKNKRFQDNYEDEPNFNR